MNTERVHPLPPPHSSFLNKYQIVEQKHKITHKQSWSDGNNNVLKI